MIITISVNAATVDKYLSIINSIKDNSKVKEVSENLKSLKSENGLKVKENNKAKVLYGYRRKGKNYVVIFKSNPKYAKKAGSIIESHIPTLIHIGSAIYNSIKLISNSIDIGKTALKDLKNDLKNADEDLPEKYCKYIIKDVMDTRVAFKVDRKEVSFYSIKYNRKDKEMLDYIISMSRKMCKCINPLTEKLLTYNEMKENF